MKKFEKPEMEVIVFESEDIIITSPVRNSDPVVQEANVVDDNVDGKGTETSIPKSTETSTSEPTETSTPEPTETSTPEPIETSTPEPTETSTQVPVDPGYTNEPGEMW